MRTADEQFLQQLGTIAEATLEPAYLLVDSAGRIVRGGGALERYGLEAPEGGELAVEFAPATEGLLPLRGESFSLRNVRFDTGPAFDLHLVASSAGDWVILLDASRRERRDRLEQQDQYDRALGIGASVEALRELSCAVFERTDDRRLRVIGSPPSWFGDILGDGDSDDPAAALPFLENFLEDAEDFWSKGVAGNLSSGVWSEAGASGSEHLLEAHALATQSGRFLLGVLRHDQSARIYRETLQKARDRELVHAAFRREAEKKEILLHCIVHDLRGPLSSMMGSLSLLADSKVSEANARKLLTLGLDQARRQEQMLGSLLDTFAAEVKALGACVTDPELAPDLLACIGTVVDSMRATFERVPAKVALEFEGGPWEEAGRLPVEGTVERLERVLFNILDNALKYGPRNGTVRVSVSREGAEALVRIEDEGPGVDPEKSDLLFQKFGRAELVRRGTGLGLYACRLTIEAWGGSIGYEPREGGGARFWFRLRLAGEQG